MSILIQQGTQIAFTISFQSPTQLFFPRDLISHITFTSDIVIRGSVPGLT